MYNVFMKVLITGGAGFVGAAVIRALISVNPQIEIMSLDDYSTGSKERHLNGKNTTYVEESTININTNPIFKEFEPETVLHLGEYSRIVPSFEEINRCHVSNTLGTFQVLEFCRKNQSKLVYSASSSKFGNNGEDQDLSPYAWMKAKNIELIKNYNAWFGLEYAVAYLFNVYGEGQIDTGAYATIIGIFQRQVLENKPLTVVGDGSQERDFTHIDDVSRGIVRIMLEGRGDGYMLGFGKKRSVLEVARAFDHPIIMVPERRGERISGQAITNKKTQEELGWKAETDIIEYIKRWKASLRLETSA